MFPPSTVYCPLKTVGGSEVHVFILSHPSAFHTYVHSKLFIVVNLFAIIGSANCNRKGWTHDSEVLMGILDSVNAEFAHQLRIALWAEHLNLYKLEGRLVDGVAGAELWLNPTASAHVVQYNENANIEDKHTDIMWDNFGDPDVSR